MLDDKYNDIINLPHHVSKKHPHMTLEERSAQFGSFAALNGYEEEIEETGRQTTLKKEINEEQKNLLDNTLEKIRKNILSRPKISCTYFIPDLNKEGGKYIKIEGNVIKIDEYNKTLIIEQNVNIPVTDIIEIDMIK